MQIRNLKRSDIKTLNNYVKLREFKLPSGRYPNFNYINLSENKDLFLVAQENKKIIGFVYGEAIKDKCAILWMIYTIKEYRKKGIATKLIQTFEQNCKKLGVNEIFLNAVPRKEILTFYKKNNFSLGNNYIECSKKI